LLAPQEEDPHKRGLADCLPHKRELAEPHKRELAGCWPHKRELAGCRPQGAG